MLEGKVYKSTGSWYLVKSKNKFFELLGNSYNVYTLDDWVYDNSYSENKLLDHFNTKSLKGFGVEDIKLGVVAAGSIIHYLDDTEHNNLTHISSLQRIFPESYVWMDRFTMKNLELFNSNSINGFNLSDTIDATKLLSNPPDNKEQISLSLIILLYTASLNTLFKPFNVTISVSSYRLYFPLIIL